MRFSVDFLGCKVSHVDAHGIRERLLADGHVEAAAGESADVAVVNGCCVTNDGGREEPQGRSPCRAHAHPRLPHRLRRKSGREFAPPGERQRRRPPRRGHRRVRGRRRRRARLRPGRLPSRPRPRLRQDSGRLLVLVRLLRDPARARRLPQPPGGRRAPRGREARRPGPPRGRPHRHQPGLLSRPRGRLRPAAARPRGRAPSAGCSGSGSARSRSTTSTTSSSPRCTTPRRSRATSMCRSSPATTASCTR